MIIVNLKGGMGNQMFQYAMARSLAEKNKDTFKMDLNFLKHGQPDSMSHVFREYDLDIFNVKEYFANKKDVDKFHSRSLIQNFIIRITNGIINWKMITENYFHFNSEIASLRGNLYLDGYWQSPKYFENIEDIIRSEFTFKNDFDEKNLKLADEIRSVNSICLNVRRSDYVVADNAKEFHGVMGFDYFEDAIEIIASKISNPVIYVFSDDIPWCRENIKSKYPVRIIDHDYAGKKFQYYLHHMSLCKHFIIPNSTFAWWGAWLCENKDKIVIAPRQWFVDQKIDTKDLIPENWIRI